MHKENKQKLNFIVVVEGKTDTAKLQKLFDVKTIETNGSALEQKTLNLINSCINKNQNLVFLTDPDHAGNMIRNKLNHSFPNIKNIFLQQKDMIKGSKKIGVAECKDRVLITLLKDVNFDQKTVHSDLIWNDYLTFNLAFNVPLRTYVINYYHLPIVNNKRLFEYLKLLNVSKEELKNVISSFKE